MEPFEYVVVLTSLILGLGIAQILMGVSDILSHWKQIKFSLPLNVYIVVVFLIHIQEWWINYQYSKELMAWTLPVVLAILIFPILLFLQARMLFPTGSRSNETDMDAYFKDQWRWLYSLGFLTVLVSIWHNLYLSHSPLLDQFPLAVYALSYFGFIVLNVKNQTAHKVFVILQLFGQIAFIVFEDGVL